MASVTSKVMKLWLIVVLGLIAYAVISSSLDSTPQPVRDAKTALQSEYRSIYQNSICDSLELKSTWYILCHPSEQAAGGLYEVTFSDADGHTYDLSAINGKGMQHADKLQSMHVGASKVSAVHPADVMAAFKDKI